MRALVVALFFLSVPASFPELPKDRASALQRGEIVVATAVPEGSNAVFVVAEGVSSTSYCGDDIMRRRGP
jgi:hypothetical protein